MIRTTCFLAFLLVLLFSSLSATEDKFVQGRHKTLSLAPAIVVNAMAFSPDGKLLAVSGERPEDNYECIPLPVQVWDVTTGERLKVVEGSASLEHSLGFSLDGTLLARALYSYVRDPAIVLYDTNTWTVERTLNSVKRESGEGIIEKFRINFRWDPVRFLPNGNLLVRLPYDRNNRSSVLGAINLEGELQREYNLPPHPFSFFHHISPDFRRILFIEQREIQKEFSTSIINEFFVYDLATMEQTHTLQIESDSWGGVFFFDEEMISFRLKSRYLWNLDSGTLRKGDFPFARFDWGASVHPSGKELAATRSRDGIEIRDRATFAVRDRLSVEGIARQALFSPTGDVLAVSTGIQPFHCGKLDAPAATIELWNVHSEEEDVENSGNEGTTLGESQARLTPDPSEVEFSADDPAWKTFTVHTSLDSVLVRANPSGSDLAIEVAGGQQVPTRDYCPAEGNDRPTSGRRDGWSLHVKACQAGKTKILLIDYDTGEVVQQYEINVIDNDSPVESQARLTPDPSEVEFSADDPAWKTFTVHTSLDSVLIRANPSGSDLAIEVAGGQRAPTREYCPAEGNDRPTSGRRDGWSLHVKACQAGKTKILLIDYDTGEVVQQYEINVEASTSAAASTTLNPSYPNPFNSETILSYTLPTASDIRLEVFTLSGQRVAVLHKGFQAAGYHTIALDASALASGVYLYRLTTPEGRFAQKFTLLR